MRLSILSPLLVFACVQQAFSAPAAPIQLKDRAAAHTSELVSFPASKAYLANAAKTVKPLADLMITGKKGASVYYGLQIEDSNVGWLFVDGICPNILDIAFQAALNPLLLKVGITTQQINFPATTTSLPAIFTAGETELTRVILKKGTKLATVTPLLDQLTKGIHDVKGGVDAVVGTNVAQNVGTLQIVAGWDSVAAHNAAISTPTLMNIITKLLAVVDIVPANVIFHQL